MPPTLDLRIVAFGTFFSCSCLLALPRVSPAPVPGLPDFAGVIALLLSGRNRQRVDPPDHAPEQPQC